MKAMYKSPQIEVMQVASSMMMDTPAISGGNVPLSTGGQASGGTVPKAPERPF